MRHLSVLLNNKKNKRGISVVVGYAVLIAMTISLSVLVFQWLRHYVGDSGESEIGCPGGVNLIIQEAKCVETISGLLNLSIKNKGRHTVDGFVVRVNNRTDSSQGFYTTGDIDQELVPGNSSQLEYLFNGGFKTGTKPIILSSINFVEIQPYKIVSGKKTYCSFVDSMKIECSKP
jgi:flagellin-like protein